MRKVRGRSAGSMTELNRAPVVVWINAPQKTVAVMSVRSVPIGWVLADWIHDPCPAYENEVVMPQVGQGLSRAVAHMQGESPSCVCVPCPWDAGASHAAIESTARDMSAIAPAPIRSPSVALSGVVRSVTLGLDWFICIWMYASNAHLIPVYASILGLGSMFNRT